MPDDDGRKVPLLAELYRQVGNTAEELAYVKNGADILYASGKKAEAISYYEHVVEAFQKLKPEATNVSVFLESVLNCFRLRGGSNL